MAKLAVSYKNVVDHRNTYNYVAFPTCAVLLRLIWLQGVANPPRLYHTKARLHEEKQKSSQQYPNSTYATFCSSE
jgi:hypothetical protein